MKKIGLVGGMSWRSTQLYYQYINEYIEENLGGLNSAEIIINSINFFDLEKVQKEKKWKEAGKIILKEIKYLEKSGAELIAICSNTGNESAEKLKRKTGAALINIANPVIEYINDKKLKRVGLIGTIHTMEENYIKGAILNKCNVELYVPNQADRKYINKVIYDELCHGIVKKVSKQKYLQIINKLIKSKKLDGFILGCTEIPMLIIQEDIKIDLINSTKLHAEYLAKKSLQKK